MSETPETVTISPVEGWQHLPLLVVPIKYEPARGIVFKLRLAVMGGYARKADLHGLELHGLHLHGEYMANADLTGTGLSRAILRRACLGHAKLCGADLRGADLRGATLDQADLESAELGRADLSAATLHLTGLRRAKLCGMLLRGAYTVAARLGRQVANGGVGGLPAVDGTGRGIKGHPAPVAVDVAVISNWSPSNAMLPTCKPAGTSGKDGFWIDIVKRLSGHSTINVGPGPTDCP